MADEAVDKKRRRFLVYSTTAMGTVGVVATAVPFVASMLPAADVEAAREPIEVDISKLKPRDQLTIEWRRLPIWIVKRSPQQLEELSEIRQLLRDPDSRVAQQPEYADNEYRSIRPDILVLVGICTHLGCIPTYRPEPASVDRKWPGGFFCACHGSKFDMAGRVFKGVPAPINLKVPSYSFIDENTLLLGVDPNNFV